MRVITYARYSSDLQRETSIADQQRECRARAQREGWTIIHELSDAAISGGTAHRPGFQALRRAAKTGECDLVMAEALDRLSRNQADTAKLFEDLTFAGIQLFTLAEGFVNELHVGLKGTMNSLWRKDHADKTRRGLRGLVLQGRMAGGLTYGYDVVRVLCGETRGERTINEQQAAIVRRIFAEYVNGLSPRTIARSLNADGIAPPRKAAWSPSTIHGHQDRGTGILNNELYIGWLVWNRQRFLIDPDTGRRLARFDRRVGELNRVAVPHLRIVSDDVWNGAKARQEAAAKAGAWYRLRPPQHLFSGLTKCEMCGGGFSVFNHDNLRCFNARQRGTCDNTRRIKRSDLERRILAAMRDKLFDVDVYDDFCESFQAEAARLIAEHTAAHSGDRARLSRVERRIGEIVNAIADGFRSDALKAELAALEAERSQLRADAVTPTYIAPPRDLARLYKQTIRELVDRVHDSGVRDTLRRFVQRIEIPREGDLRLIGNPGGLVGCGGTLATIAPAFYDVAA